MGRIKVGLQTFQMYAFSKFQFDLFEPYLFQVYLPSLNLMSSRNMVRNSYTFRKLQRSSDARVTAWLYAPPPNSTIEGFEKYRHSKITFQDPSTCKKGYATKASPRVRIMKRKSCPNLVPRYPSHLNVVKRKRKGGVVYATFREKKVKYVLESTLALCSKNKVRFEMHCTWRRNALHLNWGA